MTKCLECSETVEFDKKKQVFFENYKFPFPPLFCDNCQRKRLSKIWNFSGLNRTANCSECHEEILLHFTPTGESPIKCKKCYQTANKI